MVSGLTDEQKTALQVLSWMAILWIGAILVTDIWIVLDPPDGEPIFLWLFISLLAMCYFTTVWLTGRAMLGTGRPDRAWPFVAVMVLLVFGPLIALWKLYQ